MKIFFLINDKAGGAEYVFKQLVNTFLIKNEQIIVCFLSKKTSSFWDDLLDKDDIKIIYFNNSIFRFLKYRAYYNNRDQFIYTTHVYLTGLVGLLVRLKFIRKHRFIARESTNIFSRYNGTKLVSYKLMYLLGYSSVDLLICQTERMQVEFLKAMPYLKRFIKIRTIENPFDSKSASIVKDMSSIEIDNYIVTAGRLIHEKGFDLLIEVFNILAQKYPNLKLVVLGEGEKRDDLTQQIRNLKMGNRINLKGFVDNVYPYFKNAQLCVVSSRIEGFPNVLLQMMSQNNKVVSTKCAGGIEDIPGLFIAETNNVEDLARAMNAALEADTSTNRKIFDDYLAERSIENFISKIEYHLNND